MTSMFRIKNRFPTIPKYKISISNQFDLVSVGFQFNSSKLLIQYYIYRFLSVAKSS